MSKLDQKNFNYDYIRYQIQEDRLTLDNLAFLLIGLLLYSLFVIGFSYWGVHQDTIGWNSLSKWWMIAFCLEAVLFALQILLILLSFINHNFMHKVMMLGAVLFLYKAALDPFMALLVYYKDRGIMHVYQYPVIFILILGAVIHVHALVKTFEDDDQDDASSKLDRAAHWTKVIFFLAILASLLIQRGLGNFEAIFLTGLFSFLYICFLVLLCEHIEAAVYMFRNKYPENLEIRETDNLGSALLPPVGTVVGLAAGTAVKYGINKKPGTPPKSIIDDTKDLENKEGDEVQCLAKKIPRLFK
ncbi:hypothetical protein P9695_04080 [Weizmannia sp. CD-2023]|uniref:hypothetical protein n=1 Tax=Heyndrickxia TaxID=2837504 RepID=UPI0014594981|nr:MULTISPECIES: hypothetical protein [Heyndrickxia]MED4839508.1 hypothetical protein [Weizmannia sp. CD-2023]MED4902202.1 hypothetical protein [Weizmannia sp. CD-2023]NMH85598.1 hypothetical protein [Heyndrickxia coagulans]